MNKSFDPARLDVARFTQQAGELQGEWRLTRLTRLAESVVEPEAAAPVSWKARGESVRRPGHADEQWLALHAEAEVNLACQRCLQSLTHRLVLDTRIRFVQGEDAAERLDAEIEEDVLALTRSLDLRELVEDELLLALPIVPRHETCPEGMRPPGRGDEPDAPAANPFAVLRQLRPGSGDE
jgi:uncharacterized protein